MKSGKERYLARVSAGRPTGLRIRKPLKKRRSHREAERKELKREERAAERHKGFLRERGFVLPGEGLIDPRGNPL